MQAKSKNKQQNSKT